MSRYIKREDAITECEALTPIDSKMLKERIMSIPSADVVEVVRCRECKHWDRERGKRNNLQFDGYCEIFGGFCDPYKYCAWGERKDDE